VSIPTVASTRAAMVRTGRMATPPEWHDPVWVFATSLAPPGHDPVTAGHRDRRETTSTGSRSSTGTAIMAGLRPRERYGPSPAGFSQTETWPVLSLVNGSRLQPLQRSRRVIPASRAIRSSSAGHT
jgi:hypothetical protein